MVYLLLEGFKKSEDDNKDYSERTMEREVFE